MQGLTSNNNGRMARALSTVAIRFRGRSRRRLLASSVAAVVALLLLYSIITGMLPASAGSTAGRKVNGAAVEAPHRKVVLVVIDRIGLDDIVNHKPPNITRLISSGSTALMSARVKRDFYGQGSYVVIGAGGRAPGGSDVGLAFNQGEQLTTAGGERAKAGDVYRSRTGRSAPPGSVVNLNIEEMKKKSTASSASGDPGLLGTVLKDAGKKVALVGNADSISPTLTGQTGYQEESPEPVERMTTPSRVNVMPQLTIVHREASGIAMDVYGVVPEGNVSSDLSDRRSAQTGVTTNFTKLLAAAAGRLAVSDFLVIDMGQTSRVDEQAGFFADASLELARGRALARCDKALGKVMEMLDLSRDLVIVCAPTPTRKMITDGELLTPLVIAGPGFGPDRLLRSPTTHRDGLVSNLDIAPTVIKFFGRKALPEMEGRALFTGRSRTNPAGLERFRDNAVGAFSSRKVMVRVFVISALVILVLFLLFVLTGKDFVGAHPYIWYVLLLLILAGPAAYLLYPAFGVKSLAARIASSLGISLVLGVVALLIGRVKKGGHTGAGPRATLRTMILVSGFTLFLILLDLLIGSRLMTLSAFGSDVVLADRFYGIGNLYMGVAVGAAILFVCLATELFKSFLDKPWKRYCFAGAVLLITIVFLGYPRLGANVGGLITAVTASLVTLMKLEGGRIGLKKVIALVLVLILFVGGLLLADMLMPGSTSHAGKAVSSMKSSGISAVVSQVGRKLAANWTLAFASIWRLLVLLAIAAGLLLQWKFHLFGRIKEELPHLSAGLVGMAVGLAVALVFNDSGIEPASAITIFLFFPCFLLLVSWLAERASTETAGGEP